MCGRRLAAQHAVGLPTGRRLRAFLQLAETEGQALGRTAPSPKNPVVYCRVYRAAAFMPSHNSRSFLRETLCHHTMRARTIHGFHINPEPVLCLQTRTPGKYSEEAKHYTPCQDVFVLLGVAGDLDAMCSSLPSILFINY